MVEGAGGEEAVKLFAKAWPYKRAIVGAFACLAALFAAGYVAYSRVERLESGQAMLRKDHEALDVRTARDKEELTARVARGEEKAHSYEVELAVLKTELKGLRESIDEIRYGVRMLLRDSRIKDAAGKKKARPGEDDGGKTDAVRGGE